MKLSLLTIITCAITSILAAPQSQSDVAVSYVRSLERRKGGGGGGRGGGGGGGRGGSSGGKTGSSGSIGPGGRPYSFSPQSNVGGSTREGSGTPKQYGNYYTGGAAVPYTAGGATRSRSILPYTLPIAAVAFFPGLWLYPVFAYGYPINYSWNENGRNRTSNVTCLCQEYSVCGCDPTDNSTFLATVLTNGNMSGPPVNSTNVRTIDYNNGSVISYINGTLDNGTTASGGTDPSNEAEASAATRLIVNFGGYWFMVATVIASLTLL